MQLFYFAARGHRFNLSNTSVITRLSFLFADTLVVSPQTAFMIDVDKTYSGRQHTTKLQLVLDYLDKREPDQAAQLREYAQLIKKIRAARRKDQTGIVLIRKFENLVDEYFKIQVSDMQEGLGKFGLTQLQELMYHEAFLHYEFNDSSPEAPREGETPLSQLLQMLGDSNDQRDGVEDVFFVLPVEFLISDNLPPGTGSIAEALPGADDEGAAGADEAAVWIEPLLLLPNINTMSAVELQAVRHQMREPGKALRQAVDTWMSDSIHDRRNTLGRAHFFRDAILPAATELQAAVDGNKVLSAHRIAQADDRPIQLYAAEMPLHIMWSFHEKEGGLAEETLEILRAVWDTRGSRRYPMFIIGPPGGATGVRADAAAYMQGVEEEEEGDDSQPSGDAADTRPVSARKSIDLS